MIDRRKFLRASLLVAAAPLIVRSSSIMKIVAPAQGWPYYGGLATLEKTSQSYARHISTTEWQYDDGRRCYGLGFITIEWQEKEHPGLYVHQMSQLQKAAGNCVVYGREYYENLYARRLPSEVQFDDA